MRGIGIGRIFHGIRDQGSNFCGFRDQNSHHFWNEGSIFWVKIWDQLRKNIPRYDPVKRPSSKCNSIIDLKARLCSNGARSPEATNIWFRANEKNYPVARLGTLACCISSR